LEVVGGHGKARYGLLLLSLKDCVNGSFGSGARGSGIDGLEVSD